MYALVPRILTSFAWMDIAGYHPRKVREFQAGGFEIMEGLFVDDGPRPAGASRKESKPFRFLVPRGANLNSLASHVWRLVRSNQNMVDVLLMP